MREERANEITEKLLSNQANLFQRFMLNRHHADQEKIADLERQVWQAHLLSVSFRSFVLLIYPLLMMAQINDNAQRMASLCFLISLLEIKRLQYANTVCSVLSVPAFYSHTLSLLL